MTNLDEINFHFNSMAVIATKENWREVVTGLIGEDEVEFKPQNLNHKTPIIRIWSADKATLDRVMTRAALAGG